MSRRSYHLNALFVKHRTTKTEERDGGARKGPAHRQAVSTTGRLRVNSGRLPANAGFQERGERYSISLPD